MGQPSLYLHVLHGRKSLDEKLDDWGEDGPTIGPFQWFHVTYLTHFYFGTADGEDYAIPIEGDCLKIQGMLWGDWEIVTEPASTPLPPETLLPTRMDHLKR
jgi:hypothetical protein